MFFNKRNVIEQKELSESELALRMAKLLGDTNSVEIAEDGIAEIVEQLSRIDGLQDFLRDIMVKDIHRYFAAQTDNERAIIRGGFSRTSYIRSLIVSTK